MAIPSSFHPPDPDRAQVYVVQLIEESRSRRSSKVGVVGGASFRRCCGAISVESPTRSKMKGADADDASDEQMGWIGGVCCRLLV